MTQLSPYLIAATGFDPQIPSLLESEAQQSKDLFVVFDLERLQISGSAYLN